MLSFPNSNFAGEHFEAMAPGGKYTRIIMVGPGQRSAYCFVGNEDGQIWYTAGWAGPTLNFPRGNVLDLSTWANFGPYGLMNR